MNPILDDMTQRLVENIERQSDKRTGDIREYYA